MPEKSNKLFTAIKNVFKRDLASDKIELSIKEFKTCTSIYVLKNESFAGKIRIEIEDKDMEQKFINVLKLVK